VGEGGGLISALSRGTLDPLSLGIEDADFTRAPEARSLGSATSGARSAASGAGPATATRAAATTPPPPPPATGTATSAGSTTAPGGGAAAPTPGRGRGGVRAAALSAPGVVVPRRARAKEIRVLPESAVGRAEDLDQLFVTRQHRRGHAIAAHLANRQLVLGDLVLGGEDLSGAEHERPRQDECRQSIPHGRSSLAYCEPDHRRTVGVTASAAGRRPAEQSVTPISACVARIASSAPRISDSPRRRIEKH
jgi:hypothetical protein